MVLWLTLSSVVETVVVETVVVETVVVETVKHIRSANMGLDMVTTEEIQNLQCAVEEALLPHFSSVKVNHGKAQIIVRPSLSFPTDDPVEVGGESYPVTDEESFFEAAEAVLESAGVHDIRRKDDALFARIQ